MMRVLGPRLGDEAHPTTTPGGHSEQRLFYAELGITATPLPHPLARGGRRPAHRPAPPGPPARHDHHTPFPPQPGAGAGHPVAPGSAGAACRVSGGRGGAARPGRGHRARAPGGTRRHRTHSPSRAQRRALHAIAACRTAALGGHRAVCTTCGAERITYNSCRNRHCSKCQRLATERWLAARRRELLPLQYFHVVLHPAPRAQPARPEPPSVDLPPAVQAAASPLVY